MQKGWTHPPKHPSLQSEKGNQCFLFKLPKGVFWNYMYFEQQIGFLRSADFQSLGQYEAPLSRSESCHSLLQPIIPEVQKIGVRWWSSGLSPVASQSPRVVGPASRSDQRAWMQDTNPAVLPPMAGQVASLLPIQLSELICLGLEKKCPGPLKAFPKVADHGNFICQMKKKSSNGT